MTFNTGDRVRYNAFGDVSGFLSKHGWEGEIVEQVSTNSYKVRWDSKKDLGHHGPSYLELLEPAVNVIEDWRL